MKKEIKKLLIYFSLCIIIFSISFLTAIVLIEHIEDMTTKLTIYWVIGYLDCAIIRTVDEWLDRKIKY